MLESDVENPDCLLEAGKRVAPWRGRVFVRHISRVPQIRDGLGNKAVIQFLGLIQFVPSRIPARMEMANLLEVVANIAHDVTVHDLRVINVVEDLDPR